MQYNNINDAARDVIDYLVEDYELSPSDYPYSSDITESLNQIASILSPNTEPASTIADAFANVMDAAVINGPGSLQVPVPTPPSGETHL